MKVVCVSGKARHGKDTTAGYLKEQLEARGKKVLIAHYGDLVKYICKTFFDWDGQKDEKGRTLLQYVGTDVVRSQAPDYWVDFVASVLQMFPNEWDYVLIPDCRFPNEIWRMECMKGDFEVTHIRVIRETEGWVSPLTEEQQKHPSETALDDYKNCRPDIEIINRGNLDDLRNAVASLVRHTFNGEEISLIFTANTPLKESNEIMG